MQQNQQSFGQNFLGFSILALLCFIFYELIKFFSDIFLALDPRVAAAIVSASATIIVSVIAVLVSRFLEKQAKIAQEIREKKIPVYEELIDFVFKIIKATKKGEELPSEEVDEFMFNFSQHVIVWGSDSVLQAFYKFKHNGDSGDGSRLIICLEDLMLTIRKDLGHSNKGLSQGKILSFFINDAEQVIARSSSMQIQENNSSI